MAAPPVTAPILAVVLLCGITLARAEVDSGYEYPVPQQVFSSSTSASKGPAKTAPLSVQPSPQSTPEVITTTGTDTSTTDFITTTQQDTTTIDKVPSAPSTLAAPLPYLPPESSVSSLPQTTPTVAPSPAPAALSAQPGQPSAPANLQLWRQQLEIQRQQDVQRLQDLQRQRELQRQEDLLRQQQQQQRLQQQHQQLLLVAQQQQQQQQQLAAHQARLLQEQASLDRQRQLLLQRQAQLEEQCRQQPQPQPQPQPYVQQPRPAYSYPLPGPAPQPQPQPPPQHSQSEYSRYRGDTAPGVLAFVVQPASPAAAAAPSFSTGGPARFVSDDAVVVDNPTIAGLPVQPGPSPGAPYPAARSQRVRVPFRT